MKRITILTGLVLLAAATMGGILLFGSARPTANAQTEPPTAVVPQRTIQVNGQGHISVPPDKATVRLGVTTEALTASVALEENNVRMAQLISTTVDAGIAEEDIQTTGLRLQPIYSNDENTASTQKLAGYRASNMVEITTMDLDGLGSLLDSVVAAGGNTIEGISFEISDNEAVLAAAREAAVANAQDKAEQLTDLLGVALGEVLTITEFGGPSPTPVFMESAAVGSAAVPLAPGNQEIEVSLQVTWLLRE